MRRAWTEKELLEQWWGAKALEVSIGEDMEKILETGFEEDFAAPAITWKRNKGQLMA